MSDILLVNTYFLQLDPKQDRNMMPYPPLGALYAAAKLREDGHHVAFFDTQFADGAADVYPAIDAHAGKWLIIYDDGFNYLTKMCLVNMREACFDMIRYAHSKGCRIAISSSDATDHWKEYLEQGADYIMIGEAEQTVSELTAGGESVSDVANIPGLAYQDKGAFLRTAPRSVLRNLDELPAPAWDLVDTAAYRRKWMERHGYFSLNVATTRGCPFKCNWCAKPIYGNRYNAHSPAYVANQIADMVQHMKASHIWFCDDIFGLKPGWIKAFRQEVELRQLRFRFKIQCRADLLLEESNIADLAASGCEEVWIGAESGSQMILDAMDKGTTIAQIKESTHLMKRYGIRPCFFLQFGYPGETAVEIRETIAIMLELMPHDIGISVSYPLPGTVFYERVKSQMEGKTNWSDSDELAMMFTGTYPPAFYKVLHRYVHHLFRKAQGKAQWSNLLAGKRPDNFRRLALYPYHLMAAIQHKRQLRTIAAV